MVGPRGEGLTRDTRLMEGGGLAACRAHVFCVLWGGVEEVRGTSAQRSVIVLHGGCRMLLWNGVL